MLESVQTRRFRNRTDRRGSTKRVLLVLGMRLLLESTGNPSAAACQYSHDMPPRVVSLRDVCLSQERYAELAEQWASYVHEHPKVAIAYVYLWRARSYARLAGHPDGVRLMERAHKIDPTCPEVLSELSKLKFGSSLQSGRPRMDVVRSYALQAIEIAPDWHEPHIQLLTMSLVSGDEAESRKHLDAIVRKGGFPSPLLDFAYNILVSADPDAIILTNGDNDTFPTLALQARFGVRTDTRIVNLSLLNIARYAKATLVGSADRRGPFTESEIDALEQSMKKQCAQLGQLVLSELAKKVGRGVWKQPVYAALWVPSSKLEATRQPLEMEGLLWRIKPGPTPAQSIDGSVNASKTDSLLTNVFRLQSANDFAFPWSTESSVGMLLGNYVIVRHRVAAAYAEAGDLDGVRRMMRPAVVMLRFHPELRLHNDTDRLALLLDYWKKVDPDNPEVDHLMSDVND